MVNGISPENTPTSSSTDACPLCGGEPICQGLGVVRYDVPVDDPRFGKLFRCPNHRLDLDHERQAKLRQISNLSAYGDKTLDNFRVDLQMLTFKEQASLDMALKTARAFAAEPDGWLLLEGGYGCGKTHLAAGAGNYWLARGDVVLFITAPDLLDHLRSAYSPSSDGGYDETFDRLRNAPYLILDDLGTENPSQWAQEKLFQLLNHRYTRRLPTIITTNVDIDDLDGRIRSRLLDASLVHQVTIHAPDFRSRVQNQNEQLFSNLTLYNGMTFDSFDIENKLLPQERKNLKRAYEIAHDYAQRPSGWLVLIGDTYRGKTHLAAAIAHHQREEGKEVAFVTAPRLLDYLRETYSPDSRVKFDRRLELVQNAPFLVLDDLGTESATPWAREKLFQILDYRFLAQLPTVITTSKQVEELTDRIASRILDEGRSTVFAITGPHHNERKKRQGDPKAWR